MNKIKAEVKILKKTPLSIFSALIVAAQASFDYLATKLSLLLIVSVNRKPTKEN